jgi:DNA-binding SARP family transcriptional activator
MRLSAHTDATQRSHGEGGSIFIDRYYASCVDQYDNGVTLRLLGPVDLTAGGRTVRFSRPQQRDLMALLALHLNHPVTAERVIDDMWGGAPPRTAPTQLQNMISAVRAALSQARVDIKIRTGRFGYELTAEPSISDLHRFDGLLDDALGTEVGEVRMQLLRQALDLWRGEPLGDVRAPFAGPARIDLLERRAVAEEALYDTAISSGRHTEVLNDLSRAVAARPTRENLVAQLVEALYRSGRRVEALDAYRRAVRRLSDDYGLEPTPRLRELELRLLRDELPWVPARSARIAAELPPDISDFTGREVEAERMLAMLRRPARTVTDPPRVLVISGRAGCGKTTLAVHVGQLATTSYPDGQLYVDLAGMQPDPVQPTTVLTRFLRALGVAESAIPGDVAERSALFRSEVARRRLLVVLDNAADEAQIRPLLPGSGTCAVVATSRHRLVALAGAHHVDLGVLTGNESMALLRSIVGGVRVGQDLPGAESIVRRCGNLPLALRIAAARLAAHPHWSLGRFADALADRTRILDELAVGDLEVRASIGLSYSALSDPERRALVRLACLDAPHVASWVLAALVDTSLVQADTLIERLVEAQLVQIAGVNAAEQFRYTMHDLVRAFGRERASTDDSTGPREACARAFGCWLALAETADSRLPSPTLGRGTGSAPRWQPAGNDDRTAFRRLVADPIRWFEDERSALVAGICQAGALGMSSLAWETANTTVGFFEVHGHLDDWRKTHLAALAAVRRDGDVTGEARMLRGLGRLELERDELASALDHLTQALHLFETAGDRAGQGHTQLSLGYAHRLSGALDLAIACSVEAVDLLSADGDLRGAGYALQNVAVTQRELGDLSAAALTFQRALELAASSGDRRFLAYTRRSLGLLYEAAQDTTSARSQFTDALGRFRDLGDKFGEALALQDLGDIEPDRARGRLMLQEALAYGQESGNRFVEARALQRLGKRDIEDGSLQSAYPTLDAALRIWTELGMPLWRARSLELLAEVSAARGDALDERRLLNEAWEIYRRIGASEAESVAERLSRTAHD